jgi:8-oxo-dGTP pyrophosphatase MutT (NUDIX family)|tara:strand:+ start:37 stop:1821 length:1785 start_codon:yes stop_codon:yes gene_type:complete
MKLLLENWRKFLAEIEEPEKFWGSIAAGILPIAQSTGRVLINLRSPWVMQPLTWGVIGGKLDDNEGANIENAAKREFEEETGIKFTGSLIPIYKFQSAEGNFTYQNYIGLVKKEFTPKKNWESADFKWISFDQIEELAPKHFGLEALLADSASVEKIGEEIKKIEETIKLKTKAAPDPQLKLPLGQADYPKQAMATALQQDPEYQKRQKAYSDRTKKEAEGDPIINKCDNFTKFKCMDLDDFVYHEQACKGSDFKGFRSEQQRAQEIQDELSDIQIKEACEAYKFCFSEFKRLMNAEDINVQDIESAHDLYNDIPLGDDWEIIAERHEQDCLEYRNQQYDLQRNPDYLEMKEKEEYLRIHKQGKILKNQFTKYADRQFLDSLVTTHTANREQVIKLLSVAAKQNNLIRDEINATATLPGNWSETAWFQGSPDKWGVILKGDINLLVKDMDEIRTGYYEKYKKHLPKDAFEGGFRKGLINLPKPGSVMYDDVFILDAGDWSKVSSKEYAPTSKFYDDPLRQNEALVSNFKILAIIDLMPIRSRESWYQSEKGREAERQRMANKQKDLKTLESLSAKLNIPILSKDQAVKLLRDKK